MGFEAAPAQIGGVGDEPPAPRLCPPNFEPANDDCRLDAGTP